MFHQSGKRRRYKRQDYVCIPDLHRLTFPEQDMTVQEMVRDYCPDQIPLFIKVTYGYCGANDVDFTFSTDETYLISQLKKQPRIVLKADTGERLSFPENHTSRFHEIQEGTIPQDSEAKCLQEILERHSMDGGTVHVTPESDQHIDFYLEPGRRVSLKMKKYEIETTYDERYLIGYIVSGDTLTKAPCVIPHWMPITVSVADGMTGGGKEDLRQLLKRVTSMVKGFPNNSPEGNKEIMLFQAGFDDVIGDYDMIEPSDYYRFKLEDGNYSSKSANTASMQRTLKPPAPPPVRDDIYEAVEESGQIVRSKVMSHQADENYEEVDLSQTDTKPESNCSVLPKHVIPDTVSVLEKPETKDSISVKADRRPVIAGGGKSVTMSSDATRLQDPSHYISKLMKRQLSQNGQVTNSKPSAPQQAKIPPATAPKPVLQRTESTKSNGRETGSRSSDVAGNVDENPYSDYSRLPPPGQVLTMTVEDISDCLRVMKMSHHVDRFLEEAIDGNLLMSLDEDMLTQDFSFTAFEARKLTRFKNGWRPTTRKS